MLQFKDAEAGDTRKVTRVSCRQSEAVGECRRADPEVVRSDHDSSPRYGSFEPYVDARWLLGRVASLLQPVASAWTEREPLETVAGSLRAERDPRSARELAGTG